MKQISTLVFLFFSVLLYGHNPILSDTSSTFLYAADPAAEVFNGKVYVYCSHDQPNATGYSSMQDYMILESEDMKTWINHGVVIKPREYTWAYGQMNAPDAVYKDGWYYWYFPFYRWKIGVVRSQTPIGPWEEFNKAEITEIFDPTVIVDNDGQAYIYGNYTKGLATAAGDAETYLMGAKLKDNMIELDGAWQRLTEDAVNEAVHVFKRNGKYYFHARVGTVTKYWMADEPLPTTNYATPMGLLAPNSPTSPNHASVIEFNDKWYFFYHRGDVNNGSNYRRSACYDEIFFNEDGSIKTIEYTLPIDTLEGITIPFTEVDTLYPDISGHITLEAAGNLGYIKHNDYAVVNGVDFDTAGKYELSVNAAVPLSKDVFAGYLFVYINSELIDSITLTGTGGAWSTYQMYSTEIKINTPLSDASVKFKAYVKNEGSSNLTNLKYFNYNLIEEGANASIQVTNTFEEVNIHSLDEVLVISSFATTPMNLKIYNLGGVLLYTDKIYSKEKRVSLSGFQSGVYVAQVECADGQFVKKLIKD